MVEPTRGLAEAIREMLEDEALDLARSMLDGGHDPLDVLAQCREGMDAVGKLYERGEYFLPELVLAGDILERISALAKPLITTEGVKAESRGRVVIGTVAGDLHDIGKNIVTFMLEINGYEVTDLGIDVPVQTFVDAVRDKRPHVLKLSGFLTLAFEAMKETIDAIAAAGLRDDLKIAIGGGQVDEAVRRYTGADAYGNNAMAAVGLCNGWIGR